MELYFKNQIIIETGYYYKLKKFKNGLLNFCYYNNYWILYDLIYSVPPVCLGFYLKAGQYYYYLRHVLLHTHLQQEHKQRRY